MNYGGFHGGIPFVSWGTLIALAAYRVSEIGKEIDYQFAELLSQGRTRKAYTLIVDALKSPGFSKYRYNAAFCLLGRILSGKMHETFRQVVMVEGRAEFAHIALTNLARFRVPVLIISGDEDVSFPRNIHLKWQG